MTPHLMGRKATIFCILLTLPGLAAAQDLPGQITGAMDGLAAGFPAGEAAALAGLRGNLPAGVNGDTLGQMLYARRHFGHAAWFFGDQAVADPTDPVSLNNFAALLAETWADDPAKAPDDWLAAARAAAEAAVALNPGNAAFQNTLGNVARDMGDSDVAVAAGEAATAAAPDIALYWTNLARSYDAAGRADDAGRALAMAQQIDPSGMPLRLALAQLPDVTAPYTAAAARQCNVDFHCQEICPKSIIGGIQSVSCEIEGSSAQMACQEGKPYATSYDCKEDLPEFGILIPGLNAGFSVAVPGFSLHLLVDGQGNVDVRVEGGVSEGPLAAYLRADGHYSPSGGFSADNFGGGVRLSILPGGGNSAAAQMASDLGHPPAHLEVEAMDGKPTKVNVETYNAGVVSF
ncbi:MAG: hypothetical protein GC146_04055 [Limimaricola sp.]|uniref:hypothetical protein n=1 Tax=Limimaricola sp. TaxID=2211665 RepID=UPI001D37D115|nr:hypothetical protein [Limimaricola sp.]MBI1416375.1 hypothetical protein [Limimaricola sp.]